ncbi:MAG: FGGY-family carbohydrate kinase [Cyanobacteria bacterium]|nr:FGGY-family carbohydrate kinase [Cyanobacteriota bacterium]MDA1155903.1 FGGY-family carbohydrate kinase [Cyanobacteriota bacterium]
MIAASREPLGLGIDLGTSGLRLALMDPSGTLLAERSANYPRCFEDPQGWREGVVSLCAELPQELRDRVAAVAVDGTSGTVLACAANGDPWGQALPYFLACPEQASAAAVLAGSASGPAASASGSLARVLRLLKGSGSSSLLMRHQADWLSGWLLGDWRFGEEGNNLRLGWDLGRQCWQGAIAEQPWSAALPEVVRSGAVLGPLSQNARSALGLPAPCQVVAGSTDANAAVLAADPQPGDGVTVLGTTLVLKQFSEIPLTGPGISCHRVAGRWLVGGASNAGAGVLRQFFSDALLVELSRQIDPRTSSGLTFRPLPRPGERFPVDDPSLPPILEPRPISDALYLQGLLEGLAEIEAKGWAALQRLGAEPIQRVVSLGGGARNPQWRLIRQRILGVPVVNRPQCSAALGMARLALSATSLL